MYNWRTGDPRSPKLPQFSAIEMIVQTHNATTSDLDQWELKTRRFAQGYGSKRCSVTIGVKPLKKTEILGPWIGGRLSRNDQKFKSL